jgi:uncharacterized membrane protein YagU involved in acid resistance
LPTDNVMNRTLADACVGAIGGVVATLPMTLLMHAGHRSLPADEQYPLPPARITRRVEHKAEVAHRIDNRQHVVLSLLSHFGYGGAVAAVFPSLARRLPLSPMLAGVGWGLIVWAGSYLGYLPAVGLHPSATREPAGRNVLMIAAHVVWGAALGLFVSAARDQSQPLKTR